MLVVKMLVLLLYAVYDWFTCQSLIAPVSVIDLHSKRRYFIGGRALAMLCFLDGRPNDIECAIIRIIDKNIINKQVARVNRSILYGSVCVYACMRVRANKRLREKEKEKEIQKPKDRKKKVLKEKC